MSERKPKANSIEDLGMPTFFERNYQWAGGWDKFLETLPLSLDEAAKVFSVSPQTIWNWRTLRERLIEEKKL